MIRPVVVAALLSVTSFGVLSGLSAGDAAAQALSARPPVKGRAHKLKIDSSPQQATVFWDAGAAPNPKAFGVAGYTPITIKVPRGQVKVIIEMAGFKPQEQTLDVRKSQAVSFTLERAPRMARLDLQASGDAAGAEVFIDGTSRGTIPNSFEVAAGRHQVEVRKQGMKPFSDWFELAEGERRTRDVALERAELPSGTLLVTSDQGGDVYVDGQRRDAAPAIITGIPAGEHVVEVRKEGLAPWRQTVTVPAGQQAKVAATFGSAASAGSLRVISNEPDVDVYLDGELKGKAPAVFQNVKVGEHIVTGRKPRFKTFESTVKVAPNDTSIVSLRMEAAPPDRPRATLKIQSTVPNAEVFLDGSSLGRAPVDRNDIEPGKHYIVVHRDGYADFKREVILIENQPMAMVADLSASGTLRLLSTPGGAEVRIDGELIGKTPTVRDGVAAGDHVIELRLKDYDVYKETIKVEGGREKLFSIDLKKSGPSAEQVQKRKQGMSSFGARVNPVGAVTADFGVGYPYYLMVRATVGAFNVKPLGLDMGIEFTTFFDIYNLSVHGRLQLLEAGPLSMAVRGNVGGGSGPDGRDTYFLDMSAIASLAFGNVATFSGSFRYSAWTDKFCPTSTQRRNGITPSDFCGNPDTGTDYDHTLFGTTNPNSNRFSGSRLYAGIAAVAAIDRYMSLFLQIEFLPFPSQFSYESRKAFKDAYNPALLQDDPFVYGTAGLELKF
jgi:hypothetical protein